MSSVKRFFGVMSAEDIEKKVMLRDSSGLLINIEAGPKGWTIIYADCSTEYEDVDDTTEANYKKAYIRATTALGSLTVVHEAKWRSV